MSFVIAVPEQVQGAARDLTGIGSSLSDTAADVSEPTTGIAAAARDEVSITIASVFGNFGREFQALSTRARALHTQFVKALNAAADAYVRAEVASAQAVMPSTAASALRQDLNAFGIGVTTPYQALVSTTVTNAQTVFAASQQAFDSLSGGLSTELSLLFTDPTAFFGHLETAAQSLCLIGTPQDFASAVVNHTLGGVTTSYDDTGQPTPVPDAHVEIYQGLVGTGDFNAPSGLEGQVVTALTNAAASPLSGVLLGAAGPFVSPEVALINSTGAILTDLAGGNPAAALTDLLDTPANVVNGFFNGATLNLNPLAPVFGPFVAAGDNGAEQLDGMSFAFGGLLSPGQVIDGPGGPLHYGTGGSALNALGLSIGFLPPDPYAGGQVDIPAVPVGPIGAAAGLIDIIGQAFSGSLLG